MCEGSLRNMDPYARAMIMMVLKTGKTLDIHEIAHLGFIEQSLRQSLNAKASVRGYNSSHRQGGK